MVWYLSLHSTMWCSCARRIRAGEIHGASFASAPTLGYAVRPASVASSCHARSWSAASSASSSVVRSEQELTAGEHVNSGGRRQARQGCADRAFRTAAGHAAGRQASQATAIGPAGGTRLRPGAAPATVPLALGGANLFSDRPKRAQLRLDRRSRAPDQLQYECQSGRRQLHDPRLAPRPAGRSAR